MSYAGLALNSVGFLEDGRLVRLGYGVYGRAIDLIIDHAGLGALWTRNSRRASMNQGSSSER